MYVVIEQCVKIFFHTFLFNSSILFILRYSRSTLNMDDTFLLTSKYVIKKGSCFVWALRRAQNIYNDDAAESTMFRLKRTETVITVNNVLVIILKILVFIRIFRNMFYYRYIEFTYSNLHISVLSYYTPDHL